jgi:hypothetical protein
MNKVVYEDGAALPRPPLSANQKQQNPATKIASKQHSTTPKQISLQSVEKASNWCVAFKHFSGEDMRC